MKVHSIIVATLLTVCAYSCTRTELEPQQAELMVVLEGEGGVLRLAGNAAQTRISVQTNREDWTAISTAKWLQLKPEGTTLLVQCEANPEASERKAQVQVISGGISKQFEVYQASGTAVLELGFAPQKLDQFGGEVRVDINSNGDQWTASTEADWIKIDRDLREGQLVLTVDENTVRYERKAVVEVRASAESEPQRFEVVQSGIVYWIVPILGSGLTPDQINEGETARKHTLQGIPPQFGDRTFRYTTVSPAFTRMDYTFNYQTNHLFTKAILRNAEVLQGNELVEYVDFLKGKGFSELGHQVYWLEKQRIEAEVLLHQAEPCVRFTHYPAEEANIEVGHPFPLNGVTIGVTTAEQIDAYQASIGGVLNVANSSPTRRVFTHTPGGSRKPFTYEYTLMNGTLSQLRFTNPNFFQYVYIADKRLFATADLRRQIREAGFRYHSFGLYSLFQETYRNPETQTEMMMQMVTLGGNAIQMTFKAYR